jgi:hypothetical protein
LAVNSKNDFSSEVNHNHARQGLTILARIITRQILDKQNQEASKPRIEIEKGMEKEYAAVCNK